MIPGCLPPMLVSSMAQAIGNVLRSGTMVVGTFSNGGVTLYGFNELMGMGSISPYPFLVSGKRVLVIYYNTFDGKSYVAFDTGGVEPVWTSMVVNGKTTLRTSATSKGANPDMFTPSGTPAYQYYFAGDVLNGARSGSVPVAFYL